MKRLVLLALLAFGLNVKGAPLDEDFGYVDVRTGAHMFWVVYHTELAGNWTDHPLIMWLQGGPGASGVGYGNFMELGPYDIDGNLRPGRWTQKANVMFVDNPVGTGYSYVDDPQYYTTNNTQIADDLVTFLISVYTDYPDMQVMPFFVYAESYGGKMTADFAIALDRAIANGDITCNFQGIAMGDSWISPMDSVNTWGPYLYVMGFVNTDGLANIEASANATQDAVNQGNWIQATTQWSVTEGVVLQETDGVDFYNVLAEDSSIYEFKADLANQRQYSYMSEEVRNLYFRHVKRLSNRAQDDLYDYMNGPQAVAWNIPAGVVWDGQGGAVFNHLYEDFMKPVIDSVAYLLTNSNIHVAVYSGDLDLICDTPGTYQWIASMDYPQKPNYESVARQALTITAYPNNAAYVQRYERFSVFTILRSGHMVPIDAPEMALSMIDMITEYGAEAVPPSESEKIKNKVEAVHSKLEEAKKDIEHKEEVVENLKKEATAKVKENTEAKKEEPQEPSKVEELKKEDPKETVVTKVEKVSEKVQQTKENENKNAELKEEVKEAIKQKKSEQKHEEAKKVIKQRANAKHHHQIPHKKQEKNDIGEELKIAFNAPILNQHPSKAHH